MEDIKMEEIKKEATDSHHVFKRIKLNFKRTKVEDEEAEETDVVVTKIKRIRIKRAKTEGDTPEGDKQE